MCFHGCNIWSDLVIPIFTLIACSDVFLCLNAVQFNDREHSSITLFQGTKRYDLDAKDCPVGLAFNQAERFSCACINGIWAFYENPCLEPIAIVGGNNHCFQMPAQSIRLVVVVSNPLQATGEFLTVFEGNMDGIRSKVYKNSRIRLSDADKFVSLNSSWTLFSPDGTKSICLESNTVPQGITNEEATTFSDSTYYCSYSGLSDELPFIGGVKKGCNASMVLEPAQCQSMLPNVGEEICMSDQILKEYQDAEDLHLREEEVENELGENGDHRRQSRALTNLGRFLETLANLAPMEAQEQVAGMPSEVTQNLVYSYKGDPEWHQRWVASLGPNYTVDTNSTITPGYVNETPSRTVDLEEAWTNPRLFLNSPRSNSSRLVTNHLWMFRRMQIRNALNTTRLVPPNTDVLVQVETGKTTKLLGIHKDIMKRICPLISPSFIDTVTGTFLGLLTNQFHWKEPFLEHTHFLRIITALSLCKNEATMMKFAHSSKCSYRNTRHVGLQSLEGNETVFVQLEVPEVFQTESFEPIIEVVWKIFVTIHSYCFKNFNGQYQDHHKYTSMIAGLFSNRVHDIWLRNKTNELEYAGILGSIEEAMQGLEICATSARMTSEYPFHLSRPTKLSKFQDDNELETLIRKKRRAPDVLGTRYSSDTLSKNSILKEERRGLPKKLLSRKKRLTVNSFNFDNTVSNILYNGIGICLKKYNDQKTLAGTLC